MFPKHTRIKLISFGSEEAGLRGSKRYIAKHLGELKENKAKLLNIDSISMKDKIVVVRRETLSGTKHDKQLSQEILDIGKELILQYPKSHFSEQMVSSLIVPYLNHKVDKEKIKHELLELGKKVENKNKRIKEKALDKRLLREIDRD